MTDSLHQFKEWGHILLDEYVSMDYSYKNKRSKMAEAYMKMAGRLRVDINKAHFANMDSHKEIQDAIVVLEAMIAKRKKEIDKMGLDKVAIAPNVYELQLRANGLNNK